MKNQEPTEIKISQSDVVSGAFFRDFVAKYKAYDAKQKEIINNQRHQIKVLTSELKIFKTEVPPEKEEIKRRLKVQGKTIFDLNCRISELIAENKRLKEKLGMM